MERVKPIILADNETGRKFTLEFDRESVRFAEMHKFDIDDVGRFPMLKVPELFYYAFRMHHKNISRAETDRILFDELGGMPGGMIERLGQLYSAPFEALAMGDGEPKNARMTVEL